MRGEVFLVYLRFGESRGTAPFEKLRKLARRWFPLAVQRIVIVDNAITFDLEREVRRNVDLISGDNVEREFTGYEKGLQFLQRIGERYRLGELTNGRRVDLSRLSPEFRTCWRWIRRPLFFRNTRAGWMTGAISS